MLSLSARESSVSCSFTVLSPQIAACSYPRYSSTGHLLYEAQGHLWAVGFDLDRLEAVGDPIAVQDAAANFGLSENGTLIYVPYVGQPVDARTLVWVDREGREEALLAPPAPYESPRISPDGRYIAVEVNDPENTDVMVYDLQRDTLSRLTFDRNTDRCPLWSPDGQRVLFSSYRDGQANIYSKAADGSGPAARVTTSEFNQMAESWSADGQTLVLMELGGGNVDLKSVSLGAPSETEGLIQTQFVEYLAEVSPDGRWIAYTSNESGQMEVYVRPFSNVEDDRWIISRDGGFSPVWARDGRELFFRGSDSRDMMVVAVETEPTFDPGNREFLFAAPYLTVEYPNPGQRPWDVGDDGRFLMVKASAPAQETGVPAHINVVVSWGRGARSARADAVAMPLQPGTTLGPYEIQAPLGAGGMGEV